MLHQEISEVAQVRRFHRLVTQRAGALEDRFLGRDRPLGESRVLYEIGAQGADLRDLPLGSGHTPKHKEKEFERIAKHATKLATRAPGLKAGSDPDRVLEALHELHNERRGPVSEDDLRDDAIATYFARKPDPAAAFRNAMHRLRHKNPKPFKETKDGLIPA